MGTYQTLSAFVDDTVVSQLEMNKLRTNQDYLLDRNIDSYLDIVGTTYYTTTSTSWVDIDATNLSKTITTYGDKVLILAMGTLYSDGGTNYSYLDIQIDGTRQGHPTYGLMSGSLTNIRPILTYIKEGLTAGAAHTFKLQYKVATGTARYYSVGDLRSHIGFYVVEI